MNRTVKWCLLGLVASATMFGSSRAQDDEPAGTVQLGPRVQAPVPPPTAAEPETPADVPTSPGVVSFPNAPAPGVLSPAQPDQGSYGNYFGITRVDQMLKPRFNVDSRGGGLYGYNAGYENIGVFVPYKLDDTALVFAGAQALVTYDGRGGATVGTGWRYWSEDLDRITGLAAFFDFDNGHALPYQQVGLSFESLGRYVDYRVNGYLPVSNPDHVLVSNLTTSAALIGNGIGLLRNNVVEQAFGGFDAEVGGPTPILGRYGLNAYIGGYQFSGMGVHGGSFTGVSGRLMAQLNEDVSFGVQCTNDPMFGLNTQYQVFVNLPNGKSSRWMRNLRVQDRMVQNFFRQNRVIAKAEAFASYDTAINPETHQAYFVANINPNLKTTGNGSASTPFDSIAAYESTPLAQRQRYDIILVQPRADVTSTNLDTGGAAPTLELFNGQRLLSTSISHTFMTQNLPGQTIVLPGQTGATNPILVNSTGGDIITLAPGNTRGMEISGFNLLGNGTAAVAAVPATSTTPAVPGVPAFGGTGNGIFGNNIQNLNINNNEIHNALNGVLLTNLSGTFAAGTQAMFFNNNVHDNTATGIQVSNNGAPPALGPLEVMVQGNTFNANSGDGLRLNAQAGSSIGGIIGGDNIAATTTTPAIILANTFSNNVGNGLQLSANGGTLDFLTLSGGPATTTPVFGIVNNTFVSNGIDGLHIATTNNSIGSFDIIKNTFGNSTSNASANMGYGLNLISDSGINVINVGGATTDLGNNFFGAMLGAVTYNLTGTNVTTTNIQNNTVLISGTSGGQVILPGFDQNTLLGNDDGSTGAVPIGFNANFFGVNFNSVFVNNNGNVTLTQPLGTFTPFPIVNNGIAMLAPFFADVDTRTGSPVTYGTGTVDGHQAFGVNWLNVEHFSQGLPTNSFQLVIINRSDIAAGDFDFEFNYKQIQWESGTASGGNAAGLGGSSARVGYTNGVANSFEFPGSAINGALLDSGPAATSLIQNSINSNLLGQYIFDVRGGVVTAPTIGTINGFQINVSDNAHLQNSDISANTATGLEGVALQINTHGNAIVDSLNVHDNTFNNNGGGIELNRSDSSTLQVSVANNLLNQSSFNGLEIHASGTNIGSTVVNMTDDQMNGSGVNGLLVDSSGAAILTVNAARTTINGSTGDNILVTTNGTSVTNLNLANTISTNSTLNGLNATSSGNSTLNLTITSPSDPLFTAASQSTFTGNTLDGILLTSNNSSVMHANVYDSVVNSNLVDGIAETRNGTSLVLSNIVDSSVNTNGRHGFLFTGLGSDPTDPLQQMSGMANLVNLNGDTFNNNGTTTTANGVTTHTGDGVHADLFGQSVLVMNSLSSTFNNNAANGLSVNLSPGAQFGYAFGNQRSTFDNVTMKANGVNGIFMTSTPSNLNGVGDADSRTFFDLNANQGNSIISNNASDGILLQFVQGIHDVVISGDNNPAPPTYVTAIQGNGADGIGTDIGVQAALTVTVDGTLIGGSAAGTGNGGNGINFRDSTLFSVLNSSTGVATNWSSNTAGLGTLNVNNSIIEGNTLNGINLFGDALSGFSTQTDSNGNAVAFQNNAGDGWGILNANVTNSMIVHNGQNGVNIEIIGRMGGDHSGFYGPTTQNNLVFTNNVISSNGNDGFFMEQNAGQQLRFGSDGTSNTFRKEQFFNPPTNPGTIPLDPNNFDAFAWNTGRNAPIADAAYLSDWMNLSTMQNTNLVFTNNTVQFNGTQPNILLGDGVHIRVGTDSFLSADISSNRIAGNVHTDVFVESFAAYNPATNVAVQPPASVNSASTTVLSTVFLDDTAQMDLRFTNNSGNSVTIVSPFFNFGGTLPGNVSPNGAFYPFEAALDQYGGKSNVPRLVQLFQVDNGPGLNSSNMFTSSSGVTEDLNSQFFNADWNVRAVADPAFPNPLFPQSFDQNPNNPFLP